MAEDRLKADRLAKLEKIRALGINPYPDRFDATHSSMQALALGEKGVKPVEELMEKNADTVKLRGRLVALRSFGKLTFAHILDDSGKIQICFVKKSLSEKEEQLFELLDVGDFVGVSGELFRTKHGEITLLVSSLTFLGKALLPLPEKWHGLQDQEIKYRQRYLDTIMNREAKQRFELRSLVVRTLREFYWEKGFTEIETPILENISSGATAKPFTTHHHALDMDVYLRIAAGELWQKMAIVGGFEKTFEIARVFRNEGMDPSHLQEFTMVEHYAAYWNFEDNMKFNEEMFAHLFMKLFGTLIFKIKDRDGNLTEVDFTPPWPRKNYRDLILADSGIDILKHTKAEALRKEIKSKKIQIDGIDDFGYGNLVDHLYKKVTRPKLIQPTFVIHHPADTKPLARRNDKDPRLCDTFQLLVNTWEIVNAYSELVDPVDQEARFREQMEAKKQGDEEAMEFNKDYITAMEHGMPPISGWSVGIDRLVTLISQQDNLRDSVLFPLLRQS